MLIFQANNQVLIQLRYTANAVNYFHILLMGKRNATIKVRTPKIYEAELWFLCMTHCLIVLHNCMKFHLNSFNGCQLTERTRNSIANDQREITPKISKAELWFLCMTQCIIVLYKCMKFQPNSFNCSTYRADTKLHLLMLQGE